MSSTSALFSQKMRTGGGFSGGTRGGTRSSPLASHTPPGNEEGERGDIVLCAPHGTVHGMVLMRKYDGANENDDEYMMTP